MRIKATTHPLSARAPIEGLTVPKPFGTAPPLSSLSATAGRRTPGTLVVAPLLVERGNTWSTPGSVGSVATVAEEERAREEEAEAAAARVAAARRAAAREQTRARRAARREAARRKREKAYAEYFRGD